MERILKHFLKRLTNINSSNRSVCLLKLYREQFFDLHRLDFLYKVASFQLIGQLLSGKKKILLCDELDSRDETTNEISKNIRKISRREKLLFEESGARDLYVGWPFVEGKLSDGSPIRCPLLFFPVTLLLENGKWYLQQRDESDISLNKNFLLAYSHFNTISISDEWMETSFDDFDKEPLAFRTALYEFLKASPVEINFNQELFTDKLTAFKEYKTEEYNAVQKNGELKLYPEAVLGIFPQAGSYLVPDYEELISKNEFSEMEGFLESRVLTEEHYKIKEENSYLAFQTDASQEDALTKVKEGKSMVVQGPPGTGKSQLICNLITDFTARGKKVLLVCQKKAALDVVHERLKTKNVHPFTALVHDFRNDRTKIFEQIGNQINELENYQKQNNGLDTIYLERTFTQASRQIKQSQEELDNFKIALFNTDDFGISAKELYLTSNPSGPQISIKEFASRFNLESSIDFERKIRDFMAYALRFMKKAYAWHHRVSFADYYQRDQQSVLEVILKIPAYKKLLHESASRKIKSSIEYYSLDFFISYKDAAEKISTLITEEDEYFLLLNLLKEKTDQEWLEERKKKILLCFDKEIPETSISINELDAFEEKIKKYLDSRRNFAASLYWNIFSDDKGSLKNILLKNGLPFSPEGASELSKKIILRKKIEKEKKVLTKKNWAKSFPGKINKIEIEDWFETHFRILEAKEIIHTSAELKNLTDHSENDYKIFQGNFHLIPLLADDALLNYQQWARYLSTEMINDIVHSKVNIQDLQDILRRDFDLLTEFDKLQRELLPFETQIMQSLIDDVATISEEDKVELFRNSIRLQWLHYLEEKYPVLLSVSNLRMDQLERTLQESIGDKMKVSRDILQLRLREGAYKNIEYNRLQNRVTYRDLYHQVTKKKKLWPLRRLVSEYSEELFDLIPCWMVSPESASALFPLKDLFDLVIFDEASQCFAEQGFPAMYRGKQFVIAGDSKQLKPNDLYQARWEDETEDIPDLEIDSLLDLAGKYLPTVQLTGHYRSRNLDLIDFSNRHFYNQSLELIPYFSEINKLEPSIKYIPVKGLWENNTNPEEAKQVVKIALELLKKGDGKSIGIVTFNFKQAQLILDLLEESSTEQKILIPENFIVKNIENVQGDEKDIIIFSIGYAPDSRGRFTMQFGSLNQDGGQNRLNVAVTRAREKVYLVASILPQQLLVEESLHEGPRLLKKYLEYAWQVSEGLYKPSPIISGNQSRDWYLSKKLMELFNSSDKIYSEELPFADITVKKAEKYYSLIFTDDYLYFHARNSKEVHAYKPLELKEKGWTSKRLFSREYWLQQNISLSLL
jgi:superfamily I DNA and/or RNA helicase